MFPFLAIGAVGWVFGRKGRPKTQHRQLKAFGPVSGLEYVVDSYPDNKVFMVRASDGTTVTYEKSPKGNRVISGTGNPQTVLTIRRDFEARVEKK